jgi:hypothetical protein
MPNHEQMLYHPDDSDNDLHRDIRAPGMDGQWNMGSKVEIWRTGSHLVVSCFSLLSFSSLDPGPAQMASARVFTTFRVNQVEVDFPHAPDLPKGRH